ncbi:MAG: TraG/TraD/VirD4 family protein [Clostridia bacterium]|nr:TraG/TraD/VirD4 family protein [Clostridia bacterium]
MSIIASNIALTYKFLISNFFYIKIFNKVFIISGFFHNNYHKFKLSYYLLFAFFTFNITYNLFKKFLIPKANLKNKDLYVVNICKDLITNEEIGININNLYQNLLITGSIGSGKTTGAITQFLDLLLSKNIYGLILDVKGNYIDVVRKVAEKYNKQDKIIEISLTSEFNYNPIDKKNISSLEISNRLRTTLTILSDNNTADTFWLDKAEGYIRNFIDIIRIYNEQITFRELHLLATDTKYLKSKIELVKQKILVHLYEDFKLFEINMALNNIEKEYLNLDDRTIGIIKAEITRMTDIFISDYNISNKFDGKSNEFNFLSDKIYVLSINIADNKKLAKAISTYLKLDFQKQILSQKQSFKSSFFICDEYQEFCNEEDANFFSLSREYKCINIVSMQSYNSLVNSLKKESTAKVIIQNLVNKIWFRNDDVYTVQEIIKQIGKEKKDKATLSIGESGYESKYSLISQKFKNKKSGLSKNYSISKTSEYSLSEELFTQELNTYEAVCLFREDRGTKLYKKVRFERWES